MTHTMRPSDKKFADAFRAAGMEDYAKRAEAGEFNEFFGPHDCSMVYLVEELGRLHTRAARELRKQIINGDFDAGSDESEEWARSPDGQDAMRRLIRGE